MYLQRLKDLREDHDLRQNDIAFYLKITRQQYSLYELGRRTLPIDLLNSLADYYHTSTDYILGRTNHRNPYPNRKHYKNESSTLSSK